MRLCLGPGVIGGHTPTRIEYCKTIGLSAVIESCASIQVFADTQRFDLASLRAFRRPFDDAGIDIIAMNTAPIFPSTLMGGTATDHAIATLTGAFEVLAAGGIPIYTTTLRIPNLPAPAADEQFKRLTDFYARICPIAERVGLKIATHSPWSPVTNGWMWGATHFARLFEAVPSPANGYLYDNSILYILGDDPVEVVHRFRDRIFISHIRDVRKDPNGEGVSKTGYDEVFPGEGELDFPAMFQAFRDIGYTGGFMPEHLPRLPNDPNSNASVAYAVGYYKAVMNQK